MGAPSIRAREDASSALLNYGFRFFETRRLFAAGESVVKTRVWKGDVEEVSYGVKQDVFVTFPRGQESTLTAGADLAEPVLAPLSTDKPVGKLRIMQADRSVGTYDLYPLAAVAEAGIFGRLVDDVKLWMH